MSHDRSSGHWHISSCIRYLLLAAKKRPQWKLISTVHEFSKATFSHPFVSTRDNFETEHNQQGK